MISPFIDQNHRGTGARGCSGPAASKGRRTWAETWPSAHEAVVLAAVGLTERVARGGETAFAVVAVFAALAAAVGVGGKLAQRGPFECAHAALRVGDAGGSVRQSGVAVGVSGDAAIRGGDGDGVAARVARDAPALLFGGVDADRLARFIELVAPTAVVGLAFDTAVVGAGVGGHLLELSNIRYWKITYRAFLDRDRKCRGDDGNLW